MSETLSVPVFWRLFAKDSKLLKTSHTFRVGKVLARTRPNGGEHAVAVTHFRQLRITQ
jgi:hypothetical protein